MQRKVQQTVINRLLAVMDKKNTPSARTTILDTRRYLDDAELELERERIFSKRALIACHESEVAEVGDVLPLSLPEKNLLVVRSKTGLHVHINACSHRGASLLAERSCGKKALTCPYHAWTYDLDGSLAHVPGEQSFHQLDKSSLALRTIQHEVRHGFVWVRLDGEPIDVSASLGEALDDDFAGFDLANHVVTAERTRVVEANWKLVMDAFAEGYHLKSLHQRSLARFFLDESILDHFSPHVRQIGARRTLQEVREAPEKWDVREHTTVFYNLFPNAILVFHPTWVSVLTLWPKGVDRVQVDHRMLAPRGVDPESLQKTFAHIDQGVFEREDFLIAADIQLSLVSGARSFMTLGAAEDGMRLFHEARDLAIA